MFWESLTKKKNLYPENRYHLVSNPLDRNSAFLHLQKQLLDYCQKLNRATLGSVLFFLETGQIESGRQYFFLKPRGLQGWLCEESTSGWVISRGEKIVEQDLFLRSGTPWDIATLHTKAELRRPRVRSMQTREQIISLQLYGQIFADAIDHSL